MKLEEEFHQTLLDNYTRAGREVGYWGNYFLRDVRNKGGRATVKRMLRPRPSTKITPGLQALIDAGRIDLSVEAVSLKPRFRRLFTNEELAEAQRRLEGLPNCTQRHTTSPDCNFPDELVEDESYSEGATRRVTVNAYERNRSARKACIAKYGLRCAVCRMSFEERYGSIGRRFIHIHHKKPLAMRRREYRLRPLIDLTPVCPNCHAMLHTHDPPLGVDELRTILQKRDQE